MLQFATSVQRLNMHLQSAGSNQACYGYGLRSDVMLSRNMKTLLCTLYYIPR